MKLSYIKKQLDELESVFGFNPNQMEQGSPEWLQMKLGVISASKAKELMMKSSSKTRETYLAQLVAQVCTGKSPEINAKALDWGKDNENSARACYEFHNNLTVVEVPFVYGDSTMRTGISPDAFVIGADQDTIRKGSEIKCPLNPENFIKFICNSDIKKEHEMQCQFSMFVTGLESWDYVNYDPRMRSKQIHQYTYERNDSLMKSFEDSVQEAVHRMDTMLLDLGVRFGDQWGNKE